MQGQALIIGVGADLPVTVKDAEGLASILTDNSRCNFAKEAVNLLTAGAATRQNILSALEAMAKMPADATAFLYFSGHGYQVEASTGLSYYLMPNGYDVSKLYKTAVSGKEFAEKLAAIPAKRLLLLLDCCHAGGIAYDKGKALDLTLTKAPLPPESAALFAKGSGRIVIASSRADEVSLTGTPYSLFTRAVIEGLAGAGVAQQDGYVRALDLALYAREKVPGWSNGRQHPLVEIEQADNFVVAYYANGEKKPRPLNLPPVNTEEVERDNPPLPAAHFGPIDLRHSQGANIGNTGPITQSFGHQIDTGGAACIAGNVRVGGDLIGRDKIVYGDEVRSSGGDVNQLLLLLATLRKQVATVQMDSDEAASVQGDLATIETQVRKSQPKLSLIQAKLGSIRGLIEAAGDGGPAASALPATLQQISQLAQKLFQ